MEENELFRDSDFDATHVPTEWDEFEALDRTSMLMSQIETALYNHPGLNEEEAKLANVAFKSLFDLYQSIGGRTI